MAEDSQVSPANEKRSIRKTAKLTPAQALEILQQAVINCQQSGIIASISPFDDTNTQSVVIVLANCQINAGNIVPA